MFDVLAKEVDGLKPDELRESETWIIFKDHCWLKVYVPVSQLATLLERGG